MMMIRSLYLTDLRVLMQICKIIMSANCSVVAVAVGRLAYGGTACFPNGGLTAEVSTGFASSTQLALLNSTDSRRS